MSCHGMIRSTAAHPFNLTKAEHRVWQTMSDTGLSGKRLAAHLEQNEQTIYHHLKQIFCKLGVNSATEAVVLYYKRKQDDSQGS